MSRQDEARLGDIVDAIAAIRGHLTRGDLHDGLVYDADRVRLIEIGDRGAQGGVVSCQRGPHGVRMLGPPCCRTLDVGEEEGEGLAFPLHDPSV